MVGKDKQEIALKPSSSCHMVHVTCKPIRAKVASKLVKGCVSYSDPKPRP